MERTQEAPGRTASRADAVDRLAEPRLAGSDRVPAVLEELARYPDGVGLEELTRAVGSPEPTVHRALGVARRRRARRPRRRAGAAHLRRRRPRCPSPSPARPSPDRPPLISDPLEHSVHLMRIGAPGAEKPVARLDDDTYVDLSDVVADFDEAFFGSGGLDRVRPLVADRAAAGQVSRFAGERIGAPIARPHQILCIGLNYRDHAAETGQAVPEEPILFTKSPNTLIGPDDDVRIPRGATKPDWEVELGIVIGRRTSYLDSVEEAREAIAGYCVVNDVSERAFQMERGGQWAKGKSAETFNPAGPWLVTPDEIDDVMDLGMWLDVSGVRRQTGSTATMVFDPFVIVHHLSQFMVLEPGDLINTGTPPGVGMGFSPQIWLQPGDVMELGIDGLGTQRQHVLAPR